MNVNITPMVSICLPTFNGEKYLNETLGSIENQVFRNFELVISDDSSSDKTLEIINNFSIKTDIKIKIFVHKRNGIGANWNNCLLNASGKYIKFIMQDDLITPECLKMMVDVAEKNAGVGIVFSRRVIKLSGNVDNYDKWLKTFGVLHNKLDSEIREGIIKNQQYFNDRRFLNVPSNKIGEPTVVMFRADVVNRIGFFSEKLMQTLDFEYWYRILVNYDAYFIDSELGVFRRHEKQATSLNSQNFELIRQERVALYLSYFNNIFFKLSTRNKIFLLKNIIEAGIIQKIKYQLLRIC